MSNIIFCSNKIKTFNFTVGSSALLLPSEWFFTFFEDWFLKLFSELRLVQQLSTEWLNEQVYIFRCREKLTSFRELGELSWCCARANSNTSMHFHMERVVRRITETSFSFSRSELVNDDISDYTNLSFNSFSLKVL